MSYTDIFNQLIADNDTGTYVNGDGPPPGDSGDTFDAEIGSVYYDGFESHREIVRIWQKVTDNGDANDWLHVTDQPYETVYTFSWRPPQLPGSAGEWGGISGFIQDQEDLQEELNDKAAADHNHDSDYQPLDTDLTQVADNITQPGKNLIFGATVGDQRTTLGLGSLATASTINNTNWSGTDLSVANGGTGASDAPGARANLGVEIGTDVQAYSGQLTAVGNIATNGIIARIGLDTAAARTLTGTSGQISILNGDGVNGDPTFSLAVTTVTPDTYTNPSLTIDEFGRVTSASNGSLTLDDLEDVDAGVPELGQFLRYFGSPAAWRGVSTITDSHLVGDGLRVVGSPETLEVDDTVLRDFSSIDELADVQIGSPAAGDVLAYSSTLGAWIPSSSPNGFLIIVKGATTTNVNISNPGGSSFDSVSYSNGDFILLYGQSTASENGAWVFNGSSSALTRPSFFSTANTNWYGSVVYVQQGGSHANALYRLTTANPVVIGTTAQTWTQVSLQRMSGLAALPTTLGLVEQTASNVFGIRTIGVGSPPQVLTRALGDARFQPLDTELTALAGLTSAADRVPYFSGSGTASTTDLTSTARTLIDDTSIAAMRTTLGVAKFDIQLTLPVGSNGTVPVHQYASFAYTVDAYRAKTATGTITSKFQIDGVDIVASPLTMVITTSEKTSTAQSANSVAVGNTVQGIFTSMGSPQPTYVSLTLNCTRA